MYSLLIEHDYSHNDINHREKMKKIILANLNGHKLSLSLVCHSKAKEQRMPLLNANNPPRKRILPWGLMALRESDLNGCCSKIGRASCRERVSPYV